jgi:hypothetical protein
LYNSHTDILHKDGILYKFNQIFLYKKCSYKVKQNNVVFSMDLFNILMVSGLCGFLLLFVDVLCG